MAQAVVLLEGTVDFQMGRGGQREREARNGAKLKPVDRPEDQCGHGQPAPRVAANRWRGRTGASRARTSRGGMREMAETLEARASPRAMPAPTA